MRRLGALFAVVTCALTSGALAQGAQTRIEWLDEVASEEKQRPAGDAAAPAAAAQTRAKEALRLVPTASLFSRYELRRNYDQLGVSDLRIHDLDAIAFRARIGLGTEPITVRRGLSLDLAVVPQASGFWGPSGIDRDAALDLHEGYLRPRFGARSFLQVGRFELSYGDEWLISNNDWHETGRSFDGLRLHLQSGKTAAFFDLFGALLSEGSPIYRLASTDKRLGTGDQLLFGAYGDLGPLLLDELHLDLYALILVAPRTNRGLVPGRDESLRREAAAEATLGMRLKGRASILDYRLEGGIQFGQRVRSSDPREVSGTLAGAVDAELGFNLQELVRIGFAGQFASGDDPGTPRDESWADRFSQPHKWLGFSDVIRVRSNVLGPAAFLTVTPVAGLEFGAQGHFLFLHRAFDARQSAPDTDSAVEYGGTEVDGFVSYAIGSGLYFRAEYALFVAGASVFGDHPPVHYFGTQFGFDYP